MGGGEVALLFLPQRQMQSLPIAFSSFSVCSNEVTAFATICPVGRRFPQPSSRWLPAPLTSPNALQSGLPVGLWFYRQACLPSLSVLILFCRRVYSCESQDHLKTQEQVFVTTPMKTDNMGKHAVHL